MFAMGIAWGEKAEAEQGAEGGRRAGMGGPRGWSALLPGPGPPAVSGVRCWAPSVPKPLFSTFQTAIPGEVTPTLASRHLWRDSLSYVTCDLRQLPRSVSSCHGPAKGAPGSSSWCPQCSRGAVRSLLVNPQVCLS